MLCFQMSLVKVDARVACHALVAIDAICCAFRFRWSKLMLGLPAIHWSNLMLYVVLSDFVGS